MMGLGRGRGGPISGGGGQFYKNNYAMQDSYGDEDDMDDYGMYYAEDDSEDMEPQQYGAGSNYPPGAMFQGQNKMGMGVGGGINPTSGVPFYGQQNKAPAAGAGGFTYGGIGGGAGGFMGGIGSMPSQTTGGGGGFTYGMASQGGNLFGPPSTTANTFGGTQFGAGAAGAQKQQPGLFKFGQVSSMGGGGIQFGAASAAGGLFGSGPGVGGGLAVENDPYANIAIDLNKVKKQEPPAKLYEHKTEEEKKKEADAKKTTSTSVGKSNLKSEDKKGKDESRSGSAGDEEHKRKRSVSFGKSTTYEVERADSEASMEFINKEGAGGRGSPRPLEKKVMKEEDLGDDRTDKQKILDEIERKQREELEAMTALNQLSKGKDKANSDFDSSVGDSSSMLNTPALNANKNATSGKNNNGGQAETSNSYESDDFEDVSASGSGSKSKLTHWPGKDAFNKQKEVVPPKKQQDSYDPNAMAEYMKKQQQNPPLQKNQRAVQQQYEESQSYDEDFESMSKSQTALTSSMLTSPKQNNNKQQNTGIQNRPFEYKQNNNNQLPPVPEYKSVAEQYKQKENKFIQTDETKYDHLTPSSQIPTTYKEMTLQNNLRDAEHIIQDLKGTTAEQKEKIKDLEIQLKKKDMDLQAQRRELMNEQENAKRYLDQYKDTVHKVNLQKVEIEELIKQIDLADAKTRIKEDELKLALAEYEKKLKLQEERLLFKISKQEERDNLDLKRQHMLEREELKQKVSELEDEIHYLTTKVATIETENKKLRLNSNSNKRITELENEIEILKSQLSQTYQVQQENQILKNIKNDLSKEDQVKLQRELQQLELMVKGYQEENEKSMTKCKQLEHQLKMANEKTYNEQKRVKDLQQKVLLNSEKVYVEEKAEELDIQTVNNMGLGNAISQKTLQEMHTQLQKLQNEKLDYERDMNLKETQLKAQINKLRDEKQALEKQLIDTEFIVGDKNSELQKIKDEFRLNKEQMSQQISELEDKITWFRQNQRLIADEDKDKENLMFELTQLREKCRKLEQDVKKTIDLEKKCKLLEETIKSKNPNSIQMLLQTVKDTNTQEKQSNTQDKERVKQLEFELEQKDKEFEKKLRTLRQEQERMKQIYEKRQGQTPEAMKVKELEEEIQRTKNYYNKRIRELEDKYKFRVPEKEDKKNNSKPPTSTKNLKDQQQLNSKQQQPTIDISDNRIQEDMIDRLTKERNLLAQKVVNLETQNNKRRQSFSGQQPQPNSFVIDDSKHTINVMYSIANLIKQNKENKDTFYTLIEAVLPVLELLKGKDHSKNKIVSNKLLKVTKDYNETQKLNEPLLLEIIDFCKQDLSQSSQGQFNDLKLKHQNSASQPQMNKDINSVMNSFVDDNNTQQTKQVSHPFVIQPQQRPARDILKQVVQSGIDFERIVKDKQLNPMRLQVKDIYNILREEDQSLRNITLDEVKSIIKLVRDKSSNDVEIIFDGKNQQDEVNIYDLVNAIMDVSLDVLGILNNQEINGDVFNTRYSHDQSAKKQQQQDMSIYQDEIKRLKEQINTLQQEQNMGSYGNNEKLARFQQLISQLNNEKRDLQDKVEKLESSKQRMERILKQNVGYRSSMRKTTSTNGGDSNLEMFDELAVVLKRLEYLEQQSEEREKLSYQEHGPCKREIMRLQQEIEEERQEKVRIVNKKNAEVSYFKSELDALLSEMKSTIGNKQARRSAYQH